MMLSPKKTLRRRSAAGLGLIGVLCQLGGCEFGQITTTVEMDARELIISVVRGTILTPIDQFITNMVNEAFDNDD